MSQGLPSPVAGAALAAPQQPAQQQAPAQPQQPAQQAPAQAQAAPAQQQPAQPGITPEAIAAYQQQLQGYVQQLQQSHAQDMALRLALTRAGVHHDGYLDYAVQAYSQLAPSTRPKPHEWVPQFQAQYPAFFGQPQAPAPPGGPPPGVPGNPSLPAAAPPGAPPPGWPAPAAPAGWPPQAPPQQTWPGYPPPQQAAPQGPVWNAAAQRWEGPPPQQPAAPAGWPAPAAPAVPQLPAPPWQPPPAAPAAPAGWPQMFRPNPDAGATGTQGAGAIDPPLTEDLILKMDPTTIARRWTEVEAFMRNRNRR